MPNSQPPDLTLPPRPQPQRITRDPNVLPNSALPGPSLGPACQSRLRPNPCSNVRYANPNNAAHTQRQPRSREEGSGGARINHAQLLTALVYIAVANYRDPLSFWEAMGSEHANNWQDACQYEMDALAKNKVWILVYLPPGHKAVKS
jgi:hypothetical protein